MSSMTGGVAVSVLPTDRLLFGAAYYHEYHRRPRLADDLELMSRAGFSLIRVGESVWSTWEPEDGHFEVDWLGPVLDGAADRGISVILGTPTYAVPPWLSRRHPEIAAEPTSGVPLPFGGRQEVDFSHPAFRWHAERVIRAVLGAWAAHPAVIGVQVDNEPGLHLPRNPSTFERFVDRLRDRYGDVQRLNEAWGLTYWSHRLSDWSDLWRPDGNTFPQYDLAWRRYQADLTAEFIAWQAALTREYLRDDQFVTTCIAYSRPAAADDALASAIDVTAANIYYAMGDGLARSETPGPTDWASAGADSLFFAGDRAWSSRQQPFLVTETDATSIGGPHMNWPPYDGQLRQAAWALISRGARSIEYWHWHTIPYGAETYWGGVLPHSLRPGRVYEEVCRLGDELARARELLTGLEPEAEVALVWSHPSKWALEFAPPLTNLAGGADPRSYERIVRAFYNGFLRAGAGIRIVHDRQLATFDPAEIAMRQPVMVAAGLYAVDDATLAWLDAYAAAGGHLILGIRTAYADEEARARTDPPPGPLARAAGVTYDEYANVAREIPIVAWAESPLVVPAEAAATAWVDGLLLEEAEVLAGYDHPHFGRWPAITTRVHGAGRVTTVGTLPNPVLCGALASWALGGSTAPWGELPDVVSVARARTASGHRLHVVHNWSWDPTSLHLPLALADALSGARFAAGAQLELGPWDVRVLLENLES